MDALRPFTPFRLPRRHKSSYVEEVISSLRQEDECIAAGGQHYLTRDKTYFQRSEHNNEMLLLKIESILNVTVKKV
jgi:hypothetical protein